MLNFVLVTTKNDRHYAVPVSTPSNNNILPYIDLTYASILHPVTSRKKAAELAEFWNECFRNNGTLQEF